MPRSLPLAPLLSLLLAPALHADIVWTGAVSDDIFDEANWDLSQSTVTVIDPNVTIDDDVLIANAPVPVVIPDHGGQVRFQLGDGYTLTLDNSTLVQAYNDGVGGVPSTTIGPRVVVLDGASFESFFITHKTRLEVAAGGRAVFGGGHNPINGSTIELALGAVLAFTDETPSAYVAEHLAKTRVEGVPASEDVNVRVLRAGSAGCAVHPLGAIGVSYCGPANLNSSGAAAGLVAFGASTVLANDLTFTASAMPAGELGYLLCSQATGFVSAPRGSQGNLCLGGSIGRFVGQSQTSDAAGAFSVPVDLGALPVFPGQPALPGETWHFQVWFQDGATSNFTDGLSVVLH